MYAKYLGQLDRDDPLHEILAFRAFPDIKNPVFHVDRMSCNHLVYRYSEEKSRVSVVGKFFDLQERNEEKLSRIKGEYLNLLLLRDLGFNDQPFYVVKPLCREDRIGLALVEEFVKGKDLDHYLRNAVYRGKRHELKRSLSRLASFLHTLHSRTWGKENADIGAIDRYFLKIVKKLQRQQLISQDSARDYLNLRDRWLRRSFMAAEEVIVHGDATPTNFVFSNSDNVAAIDLERMKKSDKVFDIGMVCGELKHSFLWRTGDPYAAEPFIRHFLKKYTGNFPSPMNAFREITRRLPFYMALTEMRIARNDWLDWGYRKRIVWEAHECLRWGLRQ
ncbi:MAG: phosphotransferase [Nitrospirae bacterium]|nr:phosphotransferase [Nitrospirota bacterium]MCL5422407.1 phosphotransferase [Nitrospirota bacterium]